LLNKTLHPLFSFLNFVYYLQKITTTMATDGHFPMENVLLGTPTGATPASPVPLLLFFALKPNA